MKSLIEIALSIWIKAQCKSIESLTLDVNTSIYDLVKGKVNNISFSAYKLIYKGICISKLKIKTTLLKAKIRVRNTVPELTLNDGFKISGHLDFTPNDLIQILNNEKWCCIFYELINEKSIKHKVKSIIFKENILCISYLSEFNKSTTISLLLYIEKDKIFIENEGQSIKTYLPKDESISIHDLNIDKDFISIEFSSVVTI